MLKVNVENFKKKLIYTTAVLITGSMLSGCNAVTNNFRDSNEINKESTNDIATEEPNCLRVEVNFYGGENLSEEDLIIFFDAAGNIFNTTYSDENSKEVLIFPENLDNCKVKSRSLDTVINLPSIIEDQTWEITFDYYNKSYDVEVVDKENLLDNSSKLK